MKKINYILFILVLQISFAVEDNSINNSNTTNCFGNCYEPNADAGPNQTYYKGGIVTLDGSGSYDPEGSSISYQWTAPEGIALSGLNTAMPTFIAPESYDGSILGCSELNGVSSTEENCCIDGNGTWYDSLSCTDGSSQTEQECCEENYVGCDDGVSDNEVDCCLSGSGTWYDANSCSDGVSQSDQDCCESNSIGCDDGISSTAQDCCVDNGSDGYCSDGVSQDQEVCCTAGGDNWISGFCSDGTSQTEQACCENIPAGCIDGVSQTPEECCINATPGNQWFFGSCLDAGFGVVNPSPWASPGWNSSNQCVSGVTILDEWTDAACDGNTNNWLIASWDSNSSTCTDSYAQWISASWDDGECTNGTATWFDEYQEDTCLDNTSTTWIQSQWDGEEDVCTNGTAIWFEDAGCLEGNNIWNDNITIPFSLMVNDGEYNSLYTENSITEIIVLNENTSPIISGLASSYSISNEGEFTLDASTTSDDLSKTGVLNFSWSYDSNRLDIIDGFANSSVVTFKALETTEDINTDIILTVDDGDLSSEFFIDIDIIFNTLPFSSLGDDVEVRVGETVLIDASSSEDKETLSNALIYHWDYTDCVNLNFGLISGGTASSSTATFSAPNDQDISCEVTLEVEDEKGAMSNQWSGESVFFSEYGSGNSLSNNYLELFNGTSSSIDLDNYKITIYRDNGLIYDLDLSGLDLDIGGTLLIVKGNTTTNKPFSALDNPVEGENYTLWNSINFFSGDDPIVLYHNDSIIDIIGVVNEDPGDGWFVDGVAQGTYKKTLIRKRDVISGSEDWSDSDDDWNVYDADTYYSIGKHADTFCDNFLNISTYDNVPPVVSLSTPQNEISAPSQIDISEDDSAAIDNDEDELSYQWSVVALDLNDNVIDDDLGIEIDNSTLLNQDSQTGFVPTLIIPGSALDDYLNGIKVLLSLTVSDSFNDPVIATKSYIVSPLNASPVIEVELDDFYICNSGCDDFDNYDPYNDGDDIYEDDYILIDASATYDLTDTGELNFDWSRYILDFDQNSVNDISYSFLEGDNAKFRIGVPQYLGEDKAISITLTVDDGDDNLADQIKVMSFNLKARKPIIGVISTTNNNFIYDDNEDKYVPQIGFLYEGYALELDGSLATTDPDGGCADGTSITEQECCVNNNSVWNVEGEFCTWNNDYILWNGIADLSFTWTASDSETSILGVCVDSNDEIEVDDGGFFIPCSNSNFCDNTCSLNEYIAYLETPIHLYTTEEKNKEFEVKMKVEDNGGSNGLESEESLLSVEVVSRYPFANAGNDFSVIAGGEFRLDAYLSEDNQESEVLLGSWNQSGNIWDGLSRNIMSNYFNSELIPFAYCDGLGEDDSNETIPVSVRCDDNSQCGAGGSCNPYIFEWSQTSPIDQYGNIIGDYILLPNPVNEGSPSFVAPADISESVDLHFILKVTDPNGNESLEDDIVVTIINNDSPAIDTGGDFRTHASIDIDKDGVLTNNSEDLLQLVYLDGSYSEDLTPTIDLSYEWTSATANLDYISSEEECTANLANWDGNICHLSLDNSDKIRASFIAPNIPFGQELDLSFTFKITEDDNEVIDEVVVTVARLSTPLSPNLSANAEHEKINLYWSNEPEATIDSLTLYADFQGYRIYKSDDYGKTWGNAALDSDGDTLGWYPYAIFDYNSTQDSTYCVYSAESSVDGTNCPLSEQRNSLVTGSDPFQFWFNLGDNSGLSNSFTDTSVIDGYDYMYTITSYDRGLLPPEFEYGSYNSSGDWISNEDFIFNEFMIANYYLENKLNFEIIESFICTNELISNNQCTEENKYYYHLNVPEGVSEGEAFAYKRQVNSSRNPDGYYVGIDNDGNKIGYRSLESTMFQEHNTELISSGDFADDIVFPDLNYIDDFLVPDCRAIGTGNKTYELVDLFALTGGFMKFEIQADLDNTPIFENYSTENACLYAYRVIPNQVENERLDYIPVEYQEDIDGNAVFSEIVFEDLKFDDDNGVYYYQESGLQYEFAPNEGESGEENAGEEGGGNCDGTGEDPNADDYICEVYDSESICRVDVDCDEDLDLDDALDFNNDGIIDSYDASDLHIWRIKPGVEINDINHTIRVPIYEVDCHELKASDTALPAYLENYFEVSGIRLRFDNILERPPNEGEIRSNILINDIYSYGIGDPDSSFIDIVTERQSYDDYSFFTLEFTSGASTKKPMYDYEIEFYEDFVDNSVSLGEDNCPNSGLSGTPLPFKVKNLTTGKYVGVKHNDNGIFGGKTPQSYINTYGSAFPDPGEKDCMWQPGETILFDEDIVSLASDEPQAQKTFAFTISYSGEMMVDNNRTSICSSLIYNNTFFSYSDAINYDQGTCIWHEGMVWYAKESISAGTHAPNKWEDENGSSYYSQIDNESSNPWKPVYLWNDETNVVVESEKWFVDGDFWIADMSKLGQLSSSGPKDKEIMVVPNPYMIYSNYNSQGEGIRFTGLPTQCTITIYTISGETVDIIDHDDMFLDWHRWDLKNNHGYDVAPGLYIYRLVDKNSSFEHIGKFAIIR